MFAMKRGLCLGCGIDERAFLKWKNYITLLNDPGNSTVEAISDGNECRVFQSCEARHSAGGKKIVHGRFYVTQIATKAVTK